MLVRIRLPAFLPSCLHACAAGSRVSQCPWLGGGLSPVRSATVPAVGFLTFFDPSVYYWGAALWNHFCRQGEVASLHLEISHLVLGLPGLGNAPVCSKDASRQSRARDLGDSGAMSLRGKGSKVVLDLRVRMLTWWRG